MLSILFSLLISKIDYYHKHFTKMSFVKYQKKIYIIYFEHMRYVKNNQYYIAIVHMKQLKEKICKVHAT